MTQPKTPSSNQSPHSSGEFDFTPPPRARHHCRFYEYKLGLEGGPLCAAGLNNADPPGFAFRNCCPEPKEVCGDREEWTEEERATSAAWGLLRMERHIAALAVLPRPIPMRSGGEVDCPSCDGKIRYDRWYRGASLECSTPYCCGARFSIADPCDWPAPKGEE